MSGEQYTQIKRPVSRLTEKILGWFSWIFLLILTIVTMFIALVSFSNDTSIANLESSLNNNELIQQILGNNDLSTTQFVIWLQNGVWAIIVYFIVCLLISFLALISMNIRILSGFLFLIAAIITIPLVLLVVTLIIPILFFIIAIMMFARRDKVETVPAFYNENYGQPYYDNHEYYDDYQPHSKGPHDYYDSFMDGYEDEYEPTHTKNENRKTRRQLNKDNQQRDAYEIQNYKTQFDNEPYNNDFSEQDSYGETDDKYSQFPKRAVESEYASSQQAEEEPVIMSRQAKYNKKSKKANHDDIQQKQDFYEENRYGYGNQYDEPQVDLKELKAQRKREKAEIRAKKKEKKKAYNKRMKERRKNQPSAVNQRRMNYEERRQMVQEEQDSNQEVADNQQQSDNKK
ncbi:lipoteichoic acid stability factor AuxB [Staphylococcus saccharolyticus]|uniref:Membrane protein n=1 Tax=Staphylococcus saccharolyticus TaxID=33028 RepID=A0A380H5R8_9STAP|nr:DUF4064 domain-containing protein [Staphylococcus saccharolyticus]MBL7565527.1 DUF4064 domain-containing protein [Staphylococcus saccharolyticus]MBL7571416.1 DUF4064 domain-containing protein [Staphylococcus saccharolyticus]QQB97935.1 DUF4064 domain-containing protein [Staphylococcus saccharolyticus]QRJ66210.1 DUF4064 domain-containing protein [Staphylococcus saccharolyticus]RTY00316.1 DUF4064 domain-containing protein [Staphylococcus saccharolyticus]